MTNDTEEIARRVIGYIARSSGKNSIDRGDIANKQAFQDNLKEILDNPTSQYAGKTGLFKDIPNLEIEKENIEKEKYRQNKDRDSLQKEIHGDESSEDELKKKGLKIYHDELVKAINGDAEAESEEERVGLKQYCTNLKKDVENLNSSLSDTSKNLENVKKEVQEKQKNLSVVKELGQLKEESNIIKSWYYVFAILGLLILVVALWFSYCYSVHIFEDFKNLTNQGSRDWSDYVGIFILKIPFALILTAIISGTYIFLNKLIFIIEKINNQLRNISQISVIASQIDGRVRDSLLEKEEEGEKQENILFYKLIADYLTNLSKNELEKKEQNNFSVKDLKNISKIIYPNGIKDKNID